MVLAARPVTDADTGTALIPAPGSDVHGAVLSPSAVAPYSNLHSVIVPPFGFTVAFRVAVVCLAADAAPVTAFGGIGSVLKVLSSLESLALPFVAESLKWYVVL